MYKRQSLIPGDGGQARFLFRMKKLKMTDHENDLMGTYGHAMDVQKTGFENLFCSAVFEIRAYAVLKIGIRMRKSKI